MLDSSTSAVQEFTNDIYGQYEIRPSAQHNGIKANLIHPATEKHLAK